MNAEKPHVGIEDAGLYRPPFRQIELSIVIVSYNTMELTCDCIQSIFDSELPMSFEIIVYDNASDDASSEAIENRFSEVTVIRSTTNIGFAAANNIAVSTASGRWVLLLNPDTKVLDQGVAKLFQFAVTTDERGIFGGASVTPGGQVDHRSCWAMPSLWGLMARALGLSALAKHSAFLNPEEMPDWQRDSIKQVGVITGCFLMLKRTTWDELDGFDDDYFMYSEETDLCLRAARKGIIRTFYPNARVLHIGGASERSKPHKTIKLFRGKRLYFEKNYGKLGSRSASLILDLHVLARLFALEINHRLFNRQSAELDHWQTVWQERSAWNQPEDHMGRRLNYTLSWAIDRQRICAIDDSLSTST